jgi:hypothetical protein
MRNLSILLIFMMFSSISYAIDKPVPETKGEEKFTGALVINLSRDSDYEKIEAPADIILIDPFGRKTGINPIQNEKYSEIPNASYYLESISDAESGAPGPESVFIDVHNPVNGQYRIQVIGREKSMYALEISTYDINLEKSNVVFTKIPIEKGLMHEYKINYSDKPGSKIEVVREPATSLVESDFFAMTGLVFQFP